MLTTVGILAVVAIIIALDVPTLVRKKLRKELWVFSILLFLGTTLGIAQALRIHIPNPMDFMIAVYKPISNLIDAWLQ
ncbi:hypothetical protein [Paenibacillus segetis]|uniref:Uncharacterized protein n=1 Tax=Paenibacillus segetis TaxID=1325360 RepID=A0ABQ1YTE4_9BACL|nr:hypothetical protein [Paenibacillus segetis]GGH36974.1 hypothetical protein GCM10008013_44170 [Paenibacillus segetis]